MILTGTTQHDNFHSAEESCRIFQDQQKHAKEPKDKVLSRILNGSQERGSNKLQNLAKSLKIFGSVLKTFAGSLQ